MYIPAIQKLALHFIYIHILELMTMAIRAKRHSTIVQITNIFMPLILYRTCSSHFSHQIQSECYGGNRSVSIEGIVFKHFSAIDQRTELSYFYSRTIHGVFYSFLSDNIKKYTATPDAHRKLIVELLKNRQLIFLV